MNPWFLWYWAPNCELPLSGNVDQEIILDRFFSSIYGKSGDGHVERKAFDKYSYGKQIGIITELLLILLGSKSVKKEEKDKLIERLEEMYTEIEKLKSK